jgi:hypothetical protein
MSFSIQRDTRDGVTNRSPRVRKWSEVEGFADGQTCHVAEYTHIGAGATS